MWNPFKKKRVKSMPVDLMSKYEYSCAVGFDTWVDTHVLGLIGEYPRVEYREIISEGSLEELLCIFSDAHNPCEYAAFALQYYLVDLLGYSYARVDYAYPDEEILVLTLKP